MQASFYAVVHGTRPFAQQDSLGPVGHCALRGSFGKHRTSASAAVDWCVESIIRRNVEVVAAVLRQAALDEGRGAAFCFLVTCVSQSVIEMFVRDLWKHLATPRETNLWRREAGLTRCTTLRLFIGFIYPPRACCFSTSDMIRTALVLFLT